MKIAIVGSPESEETKLLIGAAEKRGHEAKSVEMGDLVFEAGQEKLITYQNEDIAEQFDLAIFRGINKHPDENLLLAAYLKERGVRVADERLANKRYLKTKLSTAFKFAQTGILYPKTYFVAGKKTQEVVLGKIKYPIIVKEVWGMHSESVFRFKIKDEAVEFFKNNKGEYIIQEDLEENDYFRVFVIKDKVIGALHRVKSRPLTSKEVKAGVKSTPHQPDKELTRVALEGSKISGNEICGLDIIKYKGKYWVIEANRSPQFKALSEKTGIDVADKIIEYFESIVDRK